MKSFTSFLREGVNDPSIFKAVFLAGGPGSGKSFIVGKTALPALGFKVINSDDAFENAMRKAGMDMSPENIYSDQGQTIRDRAKALTKKRMELAINGRLGLVIDGTGKDLDKIARQAKRLKEIGYDVAMIFVNTSAETALVRNRQRERSLPDDIVTKMWREVQDNIGGFQQLFGNQLHIVDNSQGSNFQSAVLGAYRKISAWAKKRPTSPVAKKWIELQSPAIKEHLETLWEQEQSCDLVSISQMKAFEKFVDRMFEKYGIDFEFTKHFGERMSDSRNNPCIQMKELADLIKKIYAKQGKNLKAEKDAQVVVKDMQSDLNIPVVVNYDQNKDEFEVVAKTIMRKKIFATPNKILKY